MEASRLRELNGMRKTASAGNILRRGKDLLTASSLRSLLKGQGIAKHRLKAFEQAYLGNLEKAQKHLSKLEQRGSSLGLGMPLEAIANRLPPGNADKIRATFTKNLSKARGRSGKEALKVTGLYGGMGATGYGAHRLLKKKEAGVGWDLHGYPGICGKS